MSAKTIGIIGGGQLGLMIAEHTNNSRLINVAEVFDEFPESIIARLYKRKVFIRFIVVFRYGCRVNAFVKIDAACRISAVVLHCHIEKKDRLTGFFFFK